MDVIQRLSVNLQPLACAFVLLTSSVAAAAPGALDPTFGEFGFTSVPFGAPQIVQPDGKVVGAGTTGNRATVARLTAKGSLDPAFGVGGIAIVPLAGDADAAAVALQPDGRIVVAGITYTEFHDHSMVFIARLNRDGTVDESYGRSGVVVVSILPPTPPVGGVHYPDYIYHLGVGLAPDGRALVGGLAHSGTGKNRTFLMRFELDGTLDDSFGAAGRTFVQFGEGVLINRVTSGPLVQADGKALMFGTYYLLSGGTGNLLDFVVRTEVDGRIDASFGADGEVLLPFVPSHALQQSDGRILVAGEQSGPPVLRVARLNEDGSFDATFGTNGVAAAAFDGCGKSVLAHNDPCPQGPTAIALQRDDRIVQTGKAFDGYSNVVALARYQPNGSPDATFGDVGRVTASATAGGWANAVDPEGTRLYVVASPQGAGFGTLARFLLVVTPGTTTIASSANPSAQGEVVTLTATVTGSSPGGVVAFLDANRAIDGCGNVPLVAAGPTAAKAVCASSFATGSHSIAAAYLGNAINSPGTSAPLIQTAGRAPESLAVEYVRTASGDYFVTSAPGEMAHLEQGDSGWQRTGQSFGVFGAGVSPVRRMCRYMLDPKYGPSSSHFFGASVAECGLGYPWKFEGDVLPVMLPKADGSCVDGTLPLHRVYNAGQGGAPRHRYTTDAGIRASMLAQGWIAEGAGVGVVACVTR